MNPITRDVMTRNQGWRDDAVCSTADPELWFPELEKSPSAELAMRICRTCPAQFQCLRWALDNPSISQFGIWGGTTPGDRDRMRSREPRGVA